MTEPGLDPKRSGWVGRAQRRIPLVHFVVDSSIWALAVPIGVVLRYDIGFSYVWEPEVGVAVVAAVMLQGLVGLLDGLYRRRWRYGTFDEVGAVAATTLIVGVVMTAVLWNTGTAQRIVPRSVPLIAAGLSLLGQVTIRSMWRLYSERRRRAGRSDVERMVVVGAGDAADLVVRTLLADALTPFLPVALVDDDPRKRNLRLSGVRVAGSVNDVVQVAQHVGATAVLVAIPSAETGFVAEVTERSRRAGLDVYTLPPVDRLFGHVQLDDIRPVSEREVLGRRPENIDHTAVTADITGRRVMVTGAGGSIGGELCRQLARFHPSALLMLDRNEGGLHATQLSIEGVAMLDDPTLILADLRDAQRIDEIFAEWQPDVVFHAAALKHLTLLERNPLEAWKTNVGGTQTLLDAARRHGTHRFVNVSTDKAADPVSVLGCTKRIAERLTAEAARLGPTECVSVRFGNVLGSSGSLLPTFEAQAARGGPLTVTDPEVTRYFMTVEEAAKLTIFAGSIGTAGDVHVLDMGEPVRIMDVAQRFAGRHDPPLDIIITGLRDNEKLHETLIGRYEDGEPRVHPAITHVEVPTLDADRLTRYDISRGITADEIRSIASEPAAVSPRTSPRLTSTPTPVRAARGA